MLDFQGPVLVPLTITPVPRHRLLSARQDLGPMAGMLSITPRFVVSYVLFPSYPHQYQNYEGFTFMCSGSTYYEYPILSSGSTYSGGSPGPDRVVYEYVIPVYFRDNPSAHPTSISNYGAFCGCIAHPGDSSNTFLQCSS